MIISHRHRFVYLGPPKTASTTLHHWLSQPAFCDHRWEPLPDSQHSSVLPTGVEHYFKFASIRDPFDRCVSLWRHSQSRTSLAAGDAPEMTFSQFVFDWQDSASYFYRCSQRQLLGSVQLDAIVRFEHLEQDLFRLPFIAAAQNLEPLPMKNRNPVHRLQTWASLRTGTLEAVIRYRWGDDLAAFGTIHPVT